MMRTKTPLLLVGIVCLLGVLALSPALHATPQPAPAPDKRYRVVIITDMTHDDDNSLIRMLHYAPLFDFEAIIVTPQLPDFPHDSDVPWNKTIEILEFDASASHDPGGDNLRFNWFHYRDAGTYPAQVTIDNPSAAAPRIAVPRDIGTRSLHIILEVHDDGDPPLVSYRRIIIQGDGS